jgi:hypothetical protein
MKDKDRVTLVPRLYLEVPRSASEVSLSLNFRKQSLPLCIPVLCMRTNAKG